MVIGSPATGFFFAKDRLVILAVGYVVVRTGPCFLSLLRGSVAMRKSIGASR
jgi:hypothetical protein